MKTKNVLLLIVTSLFLTLTSCLKQETIPSDSVTQAELVQEKRNFALPIRFENKTESEIADYFNNLTAEDFRMLEASYNVKAYLLHIGKLDLVTSTMTAGALFSELDLQQVLTNRELDGMSVFVPVEDNSRCSTLIYCVTYSPWCSGNNFSRDFGLFRRCNGTYYGWCFSCYI